MTDEKKLVLIKSAKIAYYILETIVILSPLIFWFIARFIDVDLLQASTWNLTKYAKLKVKFAIESNNGITTIPLNELITGWHFGLLFLGIAGSIAGFVIINLKRLLNNLRNNANNTRENIKNKNIMQALDTLILKQKVKELGESENEKQPPRVTE